MSCKAKGIDFKPRVIAKSLCRHTSNGVQHALSASTGCLQLQCGTKLGKSWCLRAIPMGQKPLYFHGVPDTRLIFASTLSALLQYDPSLRVLDPAAIQDNLSFGYTFDERALVRGVQRVPPGHFMRFARGKSPSSVRHFDLSQTAHQAAASGESWTTERATREVGEALRSAVHDRLVADVPLGAFLSGGIDSSLVVAMMAEADAGSVQTFTIGFEEGSYDESLHARRIAEHLGVQNTQRVLSIDQVRLELDTAVKFFDEPIADYSILPTLAVNRLAKEHVTVALTGDGADELFGGYKYYLAMQAFERSSRWLPAGVRKGVARAGALVPHAGVRRTLQRWDAKSAGHFWGRSGYYRGAVRDSTVMRLTGSLVPAQERVAEFVNGQQLATKTDAGLLFDLTHTLPNAWLHKLDRASMALSLEARSPFMDRRVVELALALPLSHKIRGGQKKAVLRDLLSRYLPRELFDRPKQGFTAPVAAWLRGELGSTVERDFREGLKPRALVDTPYLLGLLAEHRSSKADHAQLIWAVWMLEKWCQQHLA